MLSLTSRLSGFEVLNDQTVTIQNWLVFKLFANIFYHLNFAEENKFQYRKYMNEKS